MSALDNLVAAAARQGGVYVQVWTPVEDGTSPASWDVFVRSWSDLGNTEREALAYSQGRTVAEAAEDCRCRLTGRHEFTPRKEQAS